ncbi:MAG TPA: hypothetical protein PK609_03050 [Candidatus Paceibacterota bacterium]|nr:hypothetical protein [Candidatus Paceibacterota bacterium]
MRIDDVAADPREESAVSTLHLTPEVAASNRAAALLSELQMASHPRILFATYVYDQQGRKQFTLATTSKDVHLAFGKISDNARLRLCELIESRLRPSCQRIWFTFENEDKSTSKGLFLSRTEENGDVIYHVSPER